MHLVYFDESGNTGKNLEDPQQPVFVLGALVVPESVWLQVEQELEQSLERNFPSPRDTSFEVHAGDLRGGTRMFAGVSIEKRLALRDEWLAIAAKHGLQFVFRAIVKKRYQRWMESFFGKGVSVNPHLAAFPLVAQVINHLLKNAGLGVQGIFISDDNREVVGDIERFLKLLRADPGALRLDRIIEKGFFIDSTKSLILQLADLCTFQARKNEERKLGLTPKTIDDQGIALIQPLIHRGQEAFPDVLQWLAKVQK
jgi:hypothetical protein